VVAIIAILAAIAVPNFLEAQVRSQVSRAHSDMRSLANALESYSVDHNNYPPIRLGTTLLSRYRRLDRLTTPVAYITTAPIDPFYEYKSAADTFGGQRPVYVCWDPSETDVNKASPTGAFMYMPEERMRKGRWTLISAGPDRDYEQPATNYLGIVMK